MLVFFLAAFGILQKLPLPFMQDPTAWMSQEAGPLAAAVGMGLLIADVLLPVPSSLVMIAHGALFGVGVGTALSLVGSLGAAAFGFSLGRRGGPLLSRLVSEQEKVRADAMLAKWGALAIVVTRPIPLLAETTAILAGASPMGWGKLILASLAGSFPAALLYALTGATARTFGSGALMFGFVILIAGLFWLAGRKLAD